MSLGLGLGMGACPPQQPHLPGPGHAHCAPLSPPTCQDLWHKGIGGRGTAVSPLASEERQMELTRLEQDKARPPRLGAFTLFCGVGSREMG